MPRKRRCPICGVREWHKEAASGRVTCSEGHVLQDYRKETTERTELGPHAMRKRTMGGKAGRGEREMRSRADGQLYHGARARYHYFACLQVLLRKQAKVLMETWNLPPEFEVVCRDVWGLHLSLLPRPPEPDAWLPEQGDKEGDSDSDTDTASSSSSPSESSETDSLLAELLRQASESDSSEDAAREQPRTTATRKRTRNRYETPAGNIAVLMLACWTMRVPVMYADMIRLIEMYTLPYLDGVRQLPEEMRRHLARETIAMLTPHFAPGVAGLHRLTARLARLLRSEYGIETPEGNAAPVLWRTVRALQGTATLYGLAKRMAGTLGVSLGVDGRVPAEVLLAGAVVVVLKLVYGLDGSVRVSAGVNDPVDALPQEADYLISLAARHVEEPDWLDVAERALIGGNAVVVASQTEGQTRAPTETHRGHGVAGSVVPVFDTHDILGQLPAQYTTVLAAAATFLRVDTELVAACVEQHERRLARLARCP